MTVPHTPLPGQPVGGVTPPWRVVPAHIFVHIAVFVGTLSTALFRSEKGRLTLTGGPPDGMETWTWLVWLIFGLLAGPVMFISYWLAPQGGRRRYFSLWVHIVANLLALISLGIYLYTAAVIGGLLPGWAFGWCLLSGVGIFLVWLVFNDSMRLRQVERLAGHLSDSDVDQ